MKRFFALLYAATAIVTVSALALMGAMAYSSEVAVSDNVVFISDNAATDGVAGDGSSASAPLDPKTVPAHLIEENADGTVGRYYLRTALYQAADMLKEKGGTIVICGPVNIGKDQSYGSGTSNRDFFFPASEQAIRITSVYDGVDYATTKGAYLSIESPAQLTMNAPSVFEYMTIKTTGTSRVICANGNKIVMGEGLTCMPTKLSPGNTDFLSVVGGSRFNALVADTDVTVKSGEYNFIGGAQWGLDGDKYKHTGNIRISIEGGYVRGGVCGGAINTSTTPVEGNIRIDVYPEARLNSAIYGSGQARFAKAGFEVEINVYGGILAKNAANVYKFRTVKAAAGTELNYPADKYTVNFSDANITPMLSSSGTVNSLLNSLVSRARSEGFDVIKYPSVWLTACTVVSLPEATYAFEGDEISSDGAKLSLLFKNAYDNATTYNSIVEYDEDDKAFSADCSTGSAGKKVCRYYYGDFMYKSVIMNVVPAPDVSLIGAKIKTTGYDQSLRFIAQLSKNGSDMTIQEYGILAMRADLFPDNGVLDFEDTAGMNISVPQADDLNEIISDKTVYSCTFSGIRCNRYNIDLIARAYVKFTYNGETFYRYSDVMRKNPYKIAQLAVKDNSVETEAAKEFLQTKVIDVHDNYSVENGYNDSTNFRNRVINYMRAQMELTWKPSESFWINNPKDASGVTTNLYFEKGKTYKGIPYTNNNFSQKETFGDLISGGVLDISKLKGVTSCGTATSDEATALQNYKYFPGSDCSTAVITAWNTVLNSRPTLKMLTQTYYMVPGHDCGVIPVGDYEYDFETYQNNTYSMTGDTENAKKIYAAYSLLRPADAIVHYGPDGGHTRLVVSVNKSAKTVTTIECANWSIPNCTVTSGNGTKVTLTNNNTSWKELTYHFDYLLKTGYIPITIPELNTGNSDGEYTFVTQLDLENDLPKGDLTGKVISNRQIVNVDIIVSDGTNVQKISYVPSGDDKFSAVHVSRINLGGIDLSGLKLTSGKQYTFNLNVRVVGLSEKNPTVKLITNHQFIAE